jgi:tetratricopeptide (TPR) repeat protein
VEQDLFYLVGRAWAAYQSGHYDVAEREARGALAIEPNDPEALSILSLCAMQRNDQDQAVMLAERARAQGVEEPIYHYRLARIYGWFGDHKLAEVPLDKTLALDPMFAPAYSLYAWIYFARGHLDIALRAIHEALKFDPHEQYALTLRIDILKAKGSRKLAERAAREALAVNPENERAHAMAGLINLELREHEQGISHLREAARLDPGESWVRQTYAQALEERSPWARFLVRLSKSLREMSAQHYVMASIAWLVYLLHRQEVGVAIYWTWPKLSLALLLHTLLVIGWWGPLISYVMLPDLAARRIVAAELGVRERMRLYRPWHACVSLAIIISVLSVLIPGPYLAPLASGLAGTAVAFRLYELPHSRNGRIAAACFAGVVVIAAVAWSIHPHSLRSEKDYPRNPLAQSFPAVFVLSTVLLAAVWAEKQRREGNGI